MGLALEVAESRVSVPPPGTRPTRRGVDSASLSTTTARGGRVRGQPQSAREADRGHHRVMGGEAGPEGGAAEPEQDGRAGPGRSGQDWEARGHRGREALEHGPRRPCAKGEGLGWLRTWEGPWRQETGEGAWLGRGQDAEAGLEGWTGPLQSQL